SSNESRTRSRTWKLGWKSRSVCRKGGWGDVGRRRSNPRDRWFFRSARRPRNGRLLLPTAGRRSLSKLRRADASGAVEGLESALTQVPHELVLPVQLARHAQEWPPHAG